MSKETSDYVVSCSQSDLTFRSIEPSYNITLTNNDGVCGKFSWDDGICRFEGNTDEAGKLFADWVCNHVNAYIDSEVKRRVTASQYIFPWDPDFRPIA